MAEFRTFLTGAVLALAFAHPVAADEEVTHYAAEPSDTLAEAVENFTSYNEKLAGVLDRAPLSVADMEEIHEYTYTIEIALARINEELGVLPEQLEEVHLASEGDDPEALRDLASRYLETARALDR